MRTSPSIDFCSCEILLVFLLCLRRALSQSEAPIQILRRPRHPSPYSIILTRLAHLLSRRWCGLRVGRCKYATDRPKAARHQRRAPGFTVCLASGFETSYLERCKNVCPSRSHWYWLDRSSGAALFRPAFAGTALLGWNVCAPRTRDRAYHHIECQCKHGRPCVATFYVYHSLGCALCNNRCIAHRTRQGQERSSRTYIYPSVDTNARWTMTAMIGWKLMQ
jgi:hypothetical protein